LPFGLALVAPVVVFFVEPGAAFFAVAFVAILVIVFSPSQWSGTLSQKIVFKLMPDKTHLIRLGSVLQFVITNLYYFYLF
jgi:hypothetical protein